MFFYVTMNDEFAIDYNFHRVDLFLWKEILEIHKDCVNKPRLYNFLNELIESNDIKDSLEYYTFKLTSKDFNLYRNINLIMYLEDKKTSWNNLDESVRSNTWKS